jgi:hypothetical protein
VAIQEFLQSELSEIEFKPFLRYSKKNHFIKKKKRRYDTSSNATLNEASFELKTSWQNSLPTTVITDPYTYIEKISPYYSFKKSFFKSKKESHKIIIYNIFVPLSYISIKIYRHQHNNPKYAQLSDICNIPKVVHSYKHFIYKL